MQTLRTWPLLIAGAAILPAASWAAGFAAGATGAVLGQPLEFVTLLRLEPGENIGPDCISAEVTVGERRLPAGLVRTSFEMQGRDTARVRVFTNTIVDEPVVSVQLQAGCTARVSRRFVVLADPPMQPAQITPSIMAPALAATPPDVGPARAGDTSAGLGMTPQGMDGTAAAATGSAGAGSRDAGRPSPSGTATTTTTAAAPGAMATGAAPSRAQRRAEARRAAAANRADSPRATRTAGAAAEPAARRVAVAAPAVPAPSAAPRLRLEAAEPRLSAAAATAAAAAVASTANAATASAEAMAVEQALQAVQQAASAARVSAAAASAAEARIASLERSVASLRTDAQGSRDAATSLREQLSRAESASTWFWPLLAVTLLLLALAAWMARRLAVLQRTQQGEWNNELHGAQASRSSRVVGQDTQAASGFGPSQSTVQSTAAMPMGLANSRQPAAQPLPGVSVSSIPFPLGDTKPPGSNAALGTNSFTGGHAGNAGVVGLATASRSASASVAYRSGGGGNSPAWPPPAPLDEWQAPAQDAGYNQGHDSHGSNASSGDSAFAALPTVADPMMSLAERSGVQAIPPATRPTGRAAPAAGAAKPRPSTSLGERTQNLLGAGGGRVDATGPRPVSVEELIDLEQQAEFFVVLGQDEAAVDLLVEHLRNTGGGSPLPYLKLLEIHRRRGEQADYERTRTRFNHRFNAYAPEWGTELSAGRSLEDYPGVIPRMQQVWPRPLDAMAELEALLFRKLRGEMFDLPAYRDVLFLYALARDLLDREAVETGSVDLLLPLSDGTDFSSTAPAPYLSLEGELDFAHDSFDDRPTAPVDFDLSAEPERPTSIFGSLDDARNDAPHSRYNNGLPLRRL